VATAAASADSLHIRSARATAPAPDPAPAAADAADATAGDLSRDSAAYAAVRTLLPPRFRVYETRRFVILSDTDPAWTRLQARRLERASHQFDRFCRRLGVTPDPLRHKLVCVLFEARRDYRRFARDQDGVDAGWVAGYYAPANDRIVFYNVDSNPSVRDARDRLDAMELEMTDLGRRARRAASAGRVGDASALREHEGRFRQHLRSEQARIDAFAGQLGTATTIHEAIHQLLFHTRVQSPQVQYPLWICEGLATCFESVDPDRPLGPEHEFEPRRAAFQDLLDTGRLLPLRELVTLTAVPAGDDETVRGIYHQSYALVTWMSRYRRDELRDYLLRMRDLGQPRPGAAGHLALFEASFGDVDVLERSWLRRERQPRR
jgi:hypothetical protein